MSDDPTTRDRDPATAPADRRDDAASTSHDRTTPTSHAHQDPSGSAPGDVGGHGGSAEADAGGADDPDAAASRAADTDAAASDATGTDHANDEPHDDIEAVAAADPRSKGELLAELVTAEHKRDEYLDDLRRSHADFENYRRRVVRESAAQREAGKGDVASALLEVLDDLDRTREAAANSPDTDLAKGVELVADKLMRSLAGAGLVRVDEAGVAFDPNVHEAVSQVPAEESGGEPTVAEVFRPGYRLGDRVLRAAMVVVAQ